MARIDKTYCNWEQYREIKNFFGKQTIQKQKNELGFNQIPEDVEKFTGQYPLWNTGSLMDLWLAKNCKIDFIQERLHEQYSENWIGWSSDLSFNEKGFLVEAKDNESSYIAPYKPLKREGVINVFKQILVYGTTYFEYFFHKVINGVCRGEYYLLDRDPMDGLEVHFELFGLYIEFKNGKYYHKGSEIEFGCFPEINVVGIEDKFIKHFMDYEIIHSFDKKDFDEFESEQIIMSHENECFAVDSYKNFKSSKKNRYFRFIPDYIKLK